MGLFRRIFGKTNEEPINTETINTKDVTNVAEAEADTTIAVNDTAELEDVDETQVELDSATIPIATAPLPVRNVADGVTRPLSPDQMFAQDGLFASQSESITYGVATDVGKVRSNNQDAAASLFITNQSVDKHPDFGLFVVADGMGGHHDGEKASAITVRELVSEITQTIYLPMISSDPDIERVPITEAIINAVQKANEKVSQSVPDGGTTCTAVAIIDDLAHFGHVGDSRAYLITKDGLEQITRDHSLVQRLIELGQITEEEAKDHPQKNVLYRAVGQTDSLEVDALTRRLPSDSRLLICSDGLWGLVEDREIFEVTMNTPDPQQACNKLIELANAGGGQDNITVIILKVAST